MKSILAINELKKYLTTLFSYLNYFFKSNLGNKNNYKWKGYHSEINNFWIEKMGRVCFLFGRINIMFTLNNK